MTITYERADLLNSNYENDIRYTVQVHRLILSLIGVWPTLRKPRYRETLVRGIIRAVCCFLLSFNLIPWALHMFLIVDTIAVRLKMFGGLCFYSMVPAMYCALMLREDRIRECMRHVEEDWRNVRDRNDRRIMLDSARASRLILICATLFLFFSGFTYRLIQPIARSRMVLVVGNVTIRPLVQNNYYIFFDPQQSPAYEIVFSMQLLTGILIYVVTTSVCGVAALFTMHACGQLEMLAAWLENLSEEDQWSKDRTAAQKLATIIMHHVRIRRFIYQIQDVIGEMSFIEIIDSTLILCFLGYYVITGWEHNDALSTLTYAIMLVSFTFNIFILCYIGEALNSQGSKVNITSCTVDWYYLSNKEARYLILVIAMASYPTKLTAGKVIDLSFSSFGTVVRTAMAYLNLLRTVTL